MQTPAKTLVNPHTAQDLDFTKYLALLFKEEKQAEATDLSILDSLEERAAQSELKPTAYCLLDN